MRTPNCSSELAYFALWAVSLRAERPRNVAVRAIAQQTDARPMGSTISGICKKETIKTGLCLCETHLQKYSPEALQPHKGADLTE